MKLPIFLIIALVLSLPLSVNAQIYKWVDENGKIHFSDTPPPDQKAEKREIHYNTNTGIGSNLKSKEKPSDNHLTNYPTLPHERKLTKKEKAQSDKLNAAEKKHYDDCRKLSARIRKAEKKASWSKRNSSGMDAASKFRNEGAHNNKVWSLKEEYRRKCRSGG